MSTQPEPGYVPEWTIAERLTLARSVARLEKQELADRMGVSRETVGNYENREWLRRRSPAYLKSWALACGVDATWLQTGETGPTDGSGGLQRGYVHHPTVSPRLVLLKAG